MKSVDSKFVDVHGIRTRYFEKGTGENVLLIHGGVFGSNDVADCSLDWGLNFDDLAQWFHVYALDTLLGIPGGATRDEFLQAIDGHILSGGGIRGEFVASRQMPLQVYCPMN